MEDLPSGLDSDMLMDLDDPEGSDLEDDDEEFNDEPLTSPLQLPSSGPGSTATSITSSPPNNDDFLPPFNFTGKPLCTIKRGRGRPRREGGKQIPRKPLGNRVRKPRPPGMAGRGAGGSGVPRRFKSIDGFDLSLGLSNDDLTLDPETGNFVYGDKPPIDDTPYSPEIWPGKVCAFCNLGERSQLGQGEFLRLNCPEGFIPQRKASNDSPTTIVSTPEREIGDKSPRGPVTCRRQKSFNKCRHPSLTSEYVDELTIIGYAEEPEVNVLFEQTGHFYVHRSCALWSEGVIRTEHYSLENVGAVVLQSSSRKCTFCNHYGASLICKMDGCSKIYHYPCATASGAFQELPTLTTYCNNHIGQASMCETSVCYTCKILGDISNLMFCSLCGEHYHGTCVGLAQLPGVRAGWQCRKCRVCQVCRSTGDETKLMTCEQCDKVYHAGCQRPIVTSIPKYGWKCKCCRVCGDCGSRTPGAGLSSRWHAHYTVCDSCYQQRNKGFYCPICRRAYRAHAHREMVQCTSCHKFVHGTCDPEADLTSYHQKKETNPDYDYVCSLCKSINRATLSISSKRNSIEDGGDSLSASQESLYDDMYDFDNNFPESSIRNMGLGKGKPYSALKLGATTKKRLGYLCGMPGRPKGFGKNFPSSGKIGFIKRQRFSEFGRKRGPKSKMRGMFGFPGVGLQRPTSNDGKNEEEPGVENRLVLCSAKDKFVLTQDICVMCGALGTDQEGCLIGCVQCGQCYHPYCVNVKITKVILQKGWRCLDCTVCEGCGEKNDEPRLILCDDCDISYHTYCMDPPLDYVPQGTWKCKWCALCQTCGSTDPGFNCTWMNSFSECGPCASHSNCPSCTEPYSEGDLIIQCVQCERWLHGTCDSIKTEDDAEKCAEEGYNCILCRPRDVPPPHLVPIVTAKPPTPTKSPEVKSNANYFMDGIYLSESGHNLIKSLTSEHHITRKKRKKLPTVQDKEAGILATIESVVAGGSEGQGLDETPKIEMMDVKDEPQELYKEGMIWTKEDGPPPEGFTIFTMENGVSVLRRKRQRNLQKMGIGGFLVRVRGIRGGQENDDVDILPGQLNLNENGLNLNNDTTGNTSTIKRKPIRRKPKNKLSETFPAYLQEAFFGKDLLDSTKEIASSSSDEEVQQHTSDVEKNIHFSIFQDEMKHTIPNKIEKTHFDFKESIPRNAPKLIAPSMMKEEEDNAEELKDVLALPGDLIDNDLVNTIMNEGGELTKNSTSLEALNRGPDDADMTLGNAGNSKETKDDLSDILGSHFNLDAISNINSKDVEDIFKGVLTDESQESQESNTFPMQTNNMFQNEQVITQHAINQNQVVQQPPPIPQPPLRPTSLPTVQNNLNSPLSFPAQSPYHSEYSNSPQFSPAFSEPSNSWGVSPVNADPEMEPIQSGGAQVSTYNQRSSEKMKADEGLGNGATISAVLYANMNHPEWKKEYPNWNDRYKQMIKKWRTLSTEQKAPYLQQARDNRSALRMKKQQQDQDKMNSQQKTAREAEQERQWKQLQAMRHQQAQQQQHVIHEQRVQAIARAQQRNIGDINQQFLPDLQQQQTLQQIRQENPEINNHLRDLLQRQQFKKLDDKLLAGKGQQRLWPPPAEQQDNSAQDGGVVTSNLTNSNNTSGVDGTFRQPLPPSGINRPRMPNPGIPNMPRQIVGLRMQPIQNIDARMRMLMQQQHQAKQRLALNTGNSMQQPTGNIQVRFAHGIPGRPSSVEQYEQILQRQQILQKEQNANVQLKLATAPPPAAPPTNILTNQTVSTSSNQNEQEIPDNVTAELEKLEQETGTMVELQGVSDILGGLGEDDDELLAEMGADFNILEYADPELEALAGEKTNILDLDLEEETMKKERVAAAAAAAAAARQTIQTSQKIQQQEIKKEVLPNVAPPQQQQQQQHQQISQPPPLALPQHQTQNPVIHSVPPSAAPLLQQIHQHMIQQVQQAAAQNRPMPPGSRLQTPDGVTGIVTPNNNVQLHVPPNYQRILMSQLQNQKLQMRVGQSLPRMSNPSGVLPVGGQRMGVPQPPPPPYPGPPPPYPGSSNQQQQQQQQQMGLTMGPYPPYHHGGHSIHHIPPLLPHFPPTRRTLLLEEQPLLLEDLLEQEKREQEKQNHQTSEPSSALLSDHDFERLKADVFDNNLGLNQPAPNQSATVAPPQNSWQNMQNQRPLPSQSPAQPVTTPSVVDIQPRVQLFNANLLPAPPLPPENIITEQDKQTQMVYEQWLNHQNNILTQQLRYYETEVQKLRKLRKSLNSKQRQLKKSGNTLTETDATELQRISTEQSILQKHLESSRKQTRQHGMLIQEYRNKQAKQHPTGHPGQIPSSPAMMNQQQQSPLGPPSSSPIHHPSASQSPMMSPSTSSMSPLTQHNSPLHSPGNLLSHSPGPSSVLLQSPSGNNVMSPIMQQPSPRIGTPHSQNDSPVHSPSQVCLPPPMSRMTSPQQQQRRIVTSPITYDIRQSNPQLRFIRTPNNQNNDQQRVRMVSPLGYQQKSPLNSPPPQIIQHNSTILQKQIHQQSLLQQQQQQQNELTNENISQFQRAAQLIKQRNMLKQQQQQQNQQQPQSLTPQQHQMMIQQQQQLAKQQQQHIAQLQAAQARLNQQQQQQPKSPMPPKSPLVQQQLMSPHSIPPSPSPLPPRSPMMNFTPNSPSYTNIQQQQQQQPPSSPMQIQSPSPIPRSPMMNPIMSPMSNMRRPSSTPDSMSGMENPRTPYSMNDSGGNPHNPIPTPPNGDCDNFTGLRGGGIRYVKLGLRGGSPMWNFNRGAKRAPTPPGGSQDKPSSSNIPRIVRKEPHLNKVSILKKKSSVKLPQRMGSLVSSDYNDLDDSSSTPPITPPLPSTSSKKIELEEQPARHQVVLMEPTSDDIIDYDDDNNTVLSSEVSLNSAAQNDTDDIMETLSQSDLTEDVLTSPLDSVQISDEYLLFHNVVDIESEEQEYVEEHMNFVIRSPTTSDDEYIMQEKTKKFNLTETPESPEQDEVNVDPQPDIENDEQLIQQEEENIVLVDENKISEEQISTKEDFEELIDEGSRTKNLIKQQPTPSVIKLSTSNLNELKKIQQKVSIITTTPVFSTSTDGVVVNQQNRPLLTLPKIVSSTTNVSSVFTILGANSTKMSTILPKNFTVPVISASAVRQLTNVKVIDKPSSSLSLSHDKKLPTKIFEDDSVSPDSSNTEDDKKDSSDEKSDIVEMNKRIETSDMTSSPVIIHHNTPELKMTAQIVESQRNDDETNNLDDTKSVVISIPSPTPSQEQILDNITLQAIEKRRRDGKNIPNEFESFEDVLDMIENITGEPPTVLDEQKVKPDDKIETQIPQLSPLSQPTELTTNMANASQQLRNLLSLNTCSGSTTTTTTDGVVSESCNTSTSLITTTVTTSSVATSKPNDDMKKTVSTSLSLTAMLQSHPAASPTTSASIENITAASLLGGGSAISMKSNFNTSLVQAQPNVLLAQNTSTTNLLHTHLTKTKKPEEFPSKLDVETKEDALISEIKQEISGNKPTMNIQNFNMSTRCEDSQNVLLKKLLQNTGCAQSNLTTSVPSMITTTSSVGIVKQTPTLSSLLPNSNVSTSSVSTPTSSSVLVKNEGVKNVKPTTLRETSFVSNPISSPSPSNSQIPLHIDIKKCLPPSRTPSRDDLLSPQTPRSSSCSQESSLQTPPLIGVKKENLIGQSQEIKREFIDDSSQHSEIGGVDQNSRSDLTMSMLIKEEDNSDNAIEKMMLAGQKEEIKKQKRRLYQQKRRQNQLMSKEGGVGTGNGGGQPKKRPRKSSKVDEDYDTYIDSVLVQLRTLPPLNVSEPILNRNFGIVPVFGAGDQSKLGTKEYNSINGDLKGTYGDAVVPNYYDYYSTKPFGDLEAISPEKSQTSTQRGFYDKEFPPIKFDNDEIKRFDLFCREDTPDSIEGSSSPEPNDYHDKFVGLKLISDDEDEPDGDEKIEKKRMTPDPVVVVAPKPIRLKPHSKENQEMDKENVAGNEICVKSKTDQENIPPVSSPLKDAGNVTVTLTLTSSAAENIMGVLRDLANILHIPPPTTYQIVERTTSPPSHKLGLYRTKGKDGKEGAPIDIQSILNGAAKFCKHCDVVILSNMIKKKVSELPFLYKDLELLGDGDDLYFCSTTCYMQFALMHRSPSVTEDKAAAIIDHLSQKDRANELKMLKNDPFDPKNLVIERTTTTQFIDSLSKSSNNLDMPQNYPKKWKNARYKCFAYGCVQPQTKYKKPTDKETMELLYKLGVTLVPPKGVDDTRRCMFCHTIGDGVADGPGRLLNYDVDKWVHLNCALWSEGVYETVNGALMNLDNALRQSLNSVCVHCNNSGATVRCFKTRCTSVYHLNCAVKDNCVFYKNKTTFCSPHVPKNEKDNELTTLSVYRRVYINRDENRQVAAVMHHSDTLNLLRVGSLIFLNVGQLLPHQLQNFHTPNYIYPIGYKIVRFFWSIRRLNKRCRYICTIQETNGRPEFQVVIQEPPEEDIEFKDASPKSIWTRIIEQLSILRKENQCVKTFSKFVNGEDFFGLTEPAVVRVLESLPGVETLTDYKFKYGRNPLLELPLAINPSGSARTEPRLKNQQHWKQRHHTQRSATGTASALRPLFGNSLTTGPSVSTFSEATCPYSKQFVHSKSSQYKKMKQEWRNNVYLARSKIQGLGLYSARDIEKHTMVIEYIGEIIRTELAETREKAYEARNRGIYMFRLDEERVVDATLCGGLARYINHSCNPNCVAETVEVERDLKIIIFAKRRIQRGEELSYDYKFDIEDDQHKISCMCGAPNCRKWMN